MRKLPLALAFLPSLAAAEPLTVVTDIAPVHSLVAQVMGDRGTVSVLLDSGADPHSFQMRPSHARMLNGADLLVWVGPENTPWLERAKEGAAAEIADLVLLHAEEGSDHADHDDHDDHADEHKDETGHDHEAEDDHDDHDHGEHEDHDAHAHEDDHDDHVHDHAHGIDPHIWLSTVEAAEAIEHIEHALSDMDPEGAAIYEANAEAAIARLDELGHEIEHLFEDVADVPFAVSHVAYDYFVNQFGLTQVGSLRDVHNSAPSAQNVSELVNSADAGQIFCVFGEVGEDDRLIQTLVEKGAAQGADLDPLGQMVDLGPDQHAQLLRNLANALHDCLRG